MASSTLEEVAAAISADVKIVSELLRERGEALPTFSEEDAVVIKSEESEDDKTATLLQARNRLINAANDLLQLARGPVDHVVSLGYGATDTANLAAVTRFEIPQNVPSGKSISLTDLASATGLSEDHLTRIVRYAIANGIFSEPEPGQIAHTAASATLAKNKNLHDMTLFNSGFSTRIVVGLADALKAQQEKQENVPGAAFNLAYPGYVNLFDYMSKNPTASQEYFSYLDGRSQLSRYAVWKVAKSWDWASLGSGTIVDVGGSSGHASIALANSFSAAKFVVQDVNVEGLEMGRASISGNSDLESRITFQEHNFFTPQPVEAAVYFFRHILHDWSDEDCIRIIQSLLPALQDGSQVMLSEGVMPEPPALRSVVLEDKHVRIDDHVMLAAHNARERSVQQYVKLFEAASSGFSFAGVYGHGVGVHHTLVVFEYKKP
ncbi:Winged helix-turn-helix transcription repressor DNA-binding [Penicillium occitanis (nom. inval.)]|nr:Winged helix-turn-helix transcription repressor DNA-binding [Penicillium occitanis (nom. inval.)]PCG89856.1 hypothetical protein PENOC_104650 [Penicillium occitanis (nom. inval.)]